MLGAVKALKAHETRTETPKTGLIEVDKAPRSFDSRTNVQALGHPQLATRPPAKRVDRLVAIPRAKAAKHNAAFVGFAIPIIVFQEQKLGGLADISATIAQL